MTSWLKYGADIFTVNFSDVGTHTAVAGSLCVS